jgi:hypothetical protein
MTELLAEMLVVVGVMLGHSCRCLLGEALLLAMRDY